MTKRLASTLTAVPPSSATGGVPVAPSATSGSIGGGYIGGGYTGMRRAGPVRIHSGPAAGGGGVNRSGGVKRRRLCEQEAVV